MNTDQFYKENKQTLKQLKIFLKKKLKPAIASSRCDHTLKYTKQFLKENKLNQKQWIDNIGQGCDCEVLDNSLEDV